MWNSILNRINGGLYSKLIAIGLLVFLFLIIPIAFVSADEPEFEDGPIVAPDKSPKTQAMTNESSGSLIHNYSIDLPPGRNNLQPDVQLFYNSQHIDKESIVGQGWTLSIPSIERLNKSGLEAMYDDPIFSSSLSGELVDLGSGSFGSKIDNGEFYKYEFDDDVWTVTDKTGIVYTFGLSEDSRQYEDENPEHIYKWMLEEVRDTNDNFIRYEYFKDDNQLYPSSIFYTGHDTTDGIFEVIFNRESRTDVITSHRTGFVVTTNYRINNITVEVNGSWVTEYDLVYDEGDNGTTSLLHTITKSGKAEDTTVTTLPATTFEYQANASSSHWTEDTTTWDAPLFVNFMYGTMNIDINGDGYDDIVQAVRKPNNDIIKKTYLNDLEGSWEESTAYAPPVYFVWQIGNDVNLDTGARFADLNGDNRVDIVQQGVGAYFNTGFGWSSLDTDWIPPLNFAEQHDYDSPAYLANLNGDNLPDIIRARIVTVESEPVLQTKVYINDGEGWNEETDWTAPEQINTAYGSQIVDVNGDGLDDILESATTNADPIQVAYLNTGHKEWVEDSNYEPPIIFVNRPGGPTDRGARFVDVNGDALLDIIQNRTSYGSSAYLNTGSGWEEDENGYWDPPMSLVESDPLNCANSPANINTLSGDSLVEIFRTRCGTEPNTIITKAYVNNTKKVNLLKEITHPSGATTEITYKATPLYMSGSSLLNPNLPLNIETVSQIVEDDGINTPVTTTYTYEGGHYYFTSHPDGQFAGFSKVTSNDGLTKTISFYHQGNTSDSSHGEYNDHVSKIGKKYREEIRDTSGNLFLVTTNKWDKADLGSGRNFVKLAHTLESTYDGNSSHKDKAIAFTYSDSTGNTATITEYGVVTGSDDGTFTDAGSDKFTTTISYANNSTAYIKALPSEQTVTDQSSTQVKYSRFYYDGQSLGNVNVGNLTKQEDWRQVGDAYVTNLKAYNSYGLVTSETDPRSKVTEYDYDTYNLYPETVTNPLEQDTDYLYDYSAGAIKQTTDANGNVFATVYDGLDRVIEEKIPNIDVSGTVTKLTNEYTDTANAVKTKTRTYLDGSNIVDTYTYFDGLYRKIQERQETATSNQFTVRDFVYSNGLLQKESLPYFSSGTSKTTATTDTDLYTTYTYDALRRITNAATTVGNTTTSYSDWKSTITDPESKVKDVYRDAYNNLTQVDEHKDTSTYTTSYEYNYLKKLTKITDALGNLRNFTYDGVGNLLSAQDLHGSGDTTFGTWSYVYDYAGNKTSQTDPKSQVVNFTYDDINRVLTENYAGATGTEVTYEYDTCTNGIGHVCESANAAVTSEYDYNKLGQLVTEDRTIGSNGYTTTYTYDRQGNQLIITNPDSSQVKYLYDAGGLVNEIEHKESTGSFADIISSITYNPVGLPLVVTFGNGAVTTNTYDEDELYRLRTKVTVADTDSVQDLTYTYDSVGNIEQIVDDSDTQTAKTTDYTYDDLHRLVQAEITNAEEPSLEGSEQERADQGFEYDAIGNIITNPDRGSYDYDGDQGSSYANPHAVTTTSDGRTYSYDNNGNVTDDEVNTYTWDYNNRLIEVDDGTDTFTYSYDVAGQRVKADSPGDTLYYPTKFFTDTDSDNEKHIFLGDTAIASIQGTNSNADVYMIHADHLTGSNVLTDSGEEISQLIDYYAFGALRLDDQISSYKERRKFTGHEFDTDTGLTYMEARYYDPTLGRFLSQDTVFVNIVNKNKIEEGTKIEYNEYLANSQLLNSYSYVANNPLKYIDETGESISPRAIWNGVVIGATLGWQYIQHRAQTEYQEYIRWTDSFNQWTAEHPHLTDAAILMLSKGASKPGATLPKNVTPAARNIKVNLSNIEVTTRGQTLYKGNINLKPTVDQIMKGELKPRDTYLNREGLLPKQEAGYYKEYVHPTPNVNGAGPQRIIQGKGGEFYYTPNHYKSFIPLN